MDFVKFRKTGELSDVRVHLDGEVLNLHRFPLYTKSNYFLEALGSKGETDGPVSIQLEDFPGGIELFSSVADFCYNIRVEISFKNLVALSCAAQYLLMVGPGNLIDKTEYYFSSILEAATLRGQLEPLVEVMLTCSSLGECEKAVEHFELCLNVFCQCLVEAGRPSRRCSDFSDAVVKLRELNSEHFLKVLESLQSHHVSVEVLAEITGNYFAQVLQDHRRSKIQTTQTRDSEKLESEQPGASANENESSEGETESETTGESADDDDSADNGDTTAPSDGNISEGDPSRGGVTAEIDRILSAIEDKQSMTCFIPHDVIIGMLGVMFKEGGANSDGPNSEFLVGVAASMLESLPSKFLLGLPLNLVLKIVEARCASDHPFADMRCIEKYLLMTAEAGKLHLPDFNKFYALLEPKGELDSEVLLKVVQELLETGTDVSEEDRDSLLSLVNFDRVHESSLRTALDSAVIPLPHIAKASLNRCDTLRQEVANSKRVIQMLEAEIRELKVATGLSTSVRARLDVDQREDDDRRVASSVSRWTSVRGPSAARVGSSSGSVVGLSPTPARYRSLYSRWRTDPLRGLW